MNGTDATERLESEADQIRRHLDELLGELDRRRRSAVATTAQVKAYAKPVLIGALCLGVCAGLVVRYVSRRRARSRLLRVRTERWLHELAHSETLRRVRRLV